MFLRRIWSSLLVVDGGLCFFQLAGATLSGLGHAVLGFDAMAALLAVHAFSRGVRLGHGGVHGKLAFFFQLFFNLLNQFLVLLRREPLLSQKVFLKAVKAIA